jgi:hypothetical protein
MDAGWPIADMVGVILPNGKPLAKPKGLYAHLAKVKSKLGIKYDWQAGIAYRAKKSELGIQLPDDNGDDDGGGGGSGASKGGSGGSTPGGSTGNSGGKSKASGEASLLERLNSLNTIALLSSLDLQALLELDGKLTESGDQPSPQLPLHADPLECNSLQRDLGKFPNKCVGNSSTIKVANSDEISLAE